MLLPTSCCVTWGELLYLSLLQFPHLQNGHNYGVCLRIKLSELIHKKPSEKYLEPFTCLINAVSRHGIL